MTDSFLPALLLVQAAGGGGISMVGFGIQMVAIFAIFYFLMIRPQQKQRKQHETRLMELKRGDAVVTAGGVIGEVVHVRDGTKDGAPAKTLEDPITIRSGESKMIVERGRIARITTGVTTASPEK
ncbi:MAG: preprotein translocase subunit YajC [Gemmatimonadaceae bacterium]